MKMRKPKFKTDSEELAYYKAKLKQIENKAEQDKRKIKKPNDLRSVRTHRLIVKGALVEKYFRNQEDDADKFSGFLNGLVAIPGVQEYINARAATQN
jgi:hypothetical protein